MAGAATLEIDATKPPTEPWFPAAAMEQADRKSLRLESLPMHSFKLCTQLFSRLATTAFSLACWGKVKITSVHSFLTITMRPCGYTGVS
jgi:hypothetical protein